MAATPERARRGRTAVGGQRTAGVASPRKVLQLLLRFSERRPRATIQELAAELGVPSSTCYRYVALLREVGLLEEGDHGSFHVGPRIVGVARAAAAVNTVGRVARPVMERLAAEFDENVMLLRVIAGSAVCVDRVESSRAVRVSFEPGQPMPLHSGASGKTLLTFLPAGQRTAYLDELVERDPEFAARRASLEAEMELVARRGWATSFAEVDEGIWACSAAILRDPAARRPRDAGADGGRSAGAAATLSVAGPAFRIGPELQARIPGVLKAAADEIAAALAAYET